MARTSLLPAVSSPTPADVNAVNLTRLLSRLEASLLAPEASPSRARLSSYDRARISANLEHARTLLLRLEQDCAGIKSQGRKQSVQKELLQKRALIKRLNEELHELAQWDDQDDGDEDDQDSEDLLSEITTQTGDSPAKAGAQPDLPNTSNMRFRGPHGTDIASTSLASGSSHLSPPAATSSDPKTNAASTAQTEKLLGHHRAEQETLTESLLSMAQALKASSQQFGSSLEAEKEVLDRAVTGLDKNATGMEAAEKRMGALRRMSEGRGWWGRVMMYMWIAGLAVAALIIVGFLPKLRF